MGQKAQDFFKDVNVDILPEEPEELMFRIGSNQKIKKIIDGEKTITLVNEVINDLSQELRMADWEQVVLGKGHLH